MSVFSFQGIKSNMMNISSIVVLEKSTSAEGVEREDDADGQQQQRAELLPVSPGSSHDHELARIAVVAQLRGRIAPNRTI
jgi:hypothetical protein